MCIRDRIPTQRLEKGLEAEKTARKGFLPVPQCAVSRRDRREKQERKQNRRKQNQKRKQNRGEQNEGEKNGGENPPLVGTLQFPREQARHSSGGLRKGDGSTEKKLRSHKKAAPFLPCDRRGADRSPAAEKDPSQAFLAFWLLITFRRENSSRSFSSKASVMNFTVSSNRGIMIFFRALARFCVFLKMCIRDRLCRV